MKVFALLLLVGCYAGLSSAQVPMYRLPIGMIGFGGCPNARVVPNFDIERYFGVWYSIEEFYRTDLEGTSCVFAEYLPGDEGRIRVINSGRKEGELFSQEASAFVPDPNMAAKLKVQFYPGQEGGNYWVLDTDYETYTLVHGCSEYFFGWINVQSNWILGRDRLMSEEVIRIARRTFAEQGINVRRFMRSDQRDCGDEPPRPSEMPGTDRPRPSEMPVTDRPRPSEEPETERPRPFE